MQLYLVPFQKIIIINFMQVFYSLNSGLTSLLWKKSIDYIPITILVYSKNDSNLLNFFQEKIDEFDGFSYTIQNEMNQHHSVLTQLSRIYISILPFKDSDYLITSDVDCWPNSWDYFNHHFNNLFFLNNTLAIYWMSSIIYL
jgi:hypothetical protein